MKKLFTSFIQIKLIILFLLFSTVDLYSQTYTKSVIESSGPYSAIAKDKSGNIYTIKATSETKASVYKFSNGSTKGTEIYSGLTRDGITYPWGLAVSSTGVVYVSTSFDQDLSKIIKLTSAGSTYTANDFQITNNYYTGLTFDKNDNLYALQYDSSTKKYKIVKYDNLKTINSAGTDMYKNIESGEGLSYPTNLAIDSRGDIFYNEPFSIDGTDIKKGGISKVSNSITSSISTNTYSTALFIDENNDLYALEGSGSNSDYKINKYTDGNKTSTSILVGSSDLLAKSSDFIYPYGILSSNNALYYLDGDDGILGGSLVKLTLNNTPPSITNLNLDTVPWAGIGNYVKLDFNNNASVNDADFEELNNGQGDWKGAKLKIQRKDVAITNDSFWFSNPAFTVMENSLHAHGGTFANFTYENGVLEITFNSLQTIATTNLVNEVLRSITFRNDEPAGNSNIQFTFNDGFDTTDAIVTVTSNNIYVNSSVEESTINHSNGISLTEALLIANDIFITNPTIVFNAGLQPINLSSPLSSYKPIILDVQNNHISINFNKDLKHSISNLTKIGSGTLKATNFQLPLIPLILNVTAGKLSIENFNTSVNSNIMGNITVASGATLEAQGDVEANLLISGSLVIGGDTTGVLNTKGLLHLLPSSNFYLRIKDKVSDVITLDGQSMLNGNLIVTHTNYVPTLEDQFIFIKSLNSIGGSFNSYPEGLSYNINGEKFRISYKSGTGNDVSLTYKDYTTIWENSKWSNGNPDYTKDAIIKEQYNESVTANSVTFDTNITIPTGVTYSIKNQVMNLNNRQVVFEDGAYLVQENSVTNSGNISFKRKSKPIYRLETMDWSSPVTGQKIFDLSPLTLTNRFYHYDETTNTWVNNLTSNSVFTPGEYIAFRAPNTYNNYGSGSKQVFEGTFTGVPNNGVVNIPITLNNFGNNAVGNPYPSPIDLDKFLGSNPLISKVFVWTHSKPIIDGNYNGNNWITYSKGSGWDNPTISNNVIGIGQGFIVQIAQQQITPLLPPFPYIPLQFYNTMRVGSQPTISYKNAIENDKFWLSLLHGDEVMNHTLIGYISGSTINNDSEFDAEPMEIYPGIYSLLNNQLMAIQARGSKFDMNDEIKLGLKFNSADNYTIKIAKTNGLFSQGQSIFLKDHELNKIIDLTKEDYQFISDKGEFKNRFEIVYQASTLGTIENTMNNDVIIYNSGQQINIKADEMIQSVKVFDLSGKLITSFNSVNDKKLTFSIPKQTNIAIVVVNLINGKQISKKVMIK